MECRMSRRKARRKHAPVLRPFSLLGRREREWARGREDKLTEEAFALRREAERAMQSFKQSLPARTLKSIGEYRSKKSEVRAHMKRTRRPRASAVRHVPITSENEREALRVLASRSKVCPPEGIKTVAADVGVRTTGRDQTANAVRKQDVVVARKATPSQRKACEPAREGAVMCAVDAGAPRQAVTG
jgi:hypothetical protein